MTTIRIGDLGESRPHTVVEAPTYEDAVRMGFLLVAGADPEDGVNDPDWQEVAQQHPEIAAAYENAEEDELQTYAEDNDLWIELEG